MCRVAMWNKKGEQLLNKKMGLTEFMSYLEKAFGGHGNGFALLYPNGTIKMNKGVNLSCQDIARIISKENYKWCVFHTRIASVGNVADKNCHPFKYGNTALAMNGTESGFSRIGNLLGMTDTEAVLHTTKKFGKSVYEMAQNLDSVYMGFEDGKPFVTAGGTYTDLEILNEGDAVCFASQFPYTIQSYVPNKKPFAWHEGKTIEVVKRTSVSSKGRSSYLSDYDDYENWWDENQYNKNSNYTKSTTTATKTEDKKDEEDVNSGKAYMSIGEGKIKEIGMSDGEELLDNEVNLGKPLEDGDYLDSAMNELSKQEQQTIDNLCGDAV